MSESLIIKQYTALIEDTNDEISVLSNSSAFLNQMMADISWVGFYILKNNHLVLGPFQGKVACTTIPMNKGVCGTSAFKRQTILVENVHEFAGHIACDSATNSEIVVPIIIKDELYGVLDLDSTSFTRFTKHDQILLEELVTLLVKKLEYIQQQ